MVKKGYKQTEVGVVPKEWSVMTLRDIADFLGGGTPSKSIAEYWNGDIPWISSSDISLNSVHGLNITRYITGQAVKESSTQLCPRNAILIVTRVGVGKIAIAPTNICTSQDFTNIVLRQDNVEYVARALQPVFYCMSNETQGTSIKGVTTDEVKNTSIALPPIKEQEQIATVLSEIDELISLTEKQISKKKAIKQGAMQELLTGKRRLPGFSETWEEKPISFFGNFISGNCFPIEYQGCPRGELPFYKVSDFNNAGNSRVMGKANNYISHNIASVLSCKIIPKNSVVFAKIGAAISLERKRITGFDCCIDNNMMSFLPYQKNVAAYMCYLFQTIRFGEFVEATALPSLSGKTIGEIQRTFPPTVEEQIAIATVLSDLDSEIEALEQKLTRYRQVKQGMMQQLLTGKIRIL